MKKIMKDFLLRGLIACGFGPIVLAILYLILQKQDLIETLTVNEVCLGIFSISALAFLAGGLNVIYQIERLPLMAAILIHGGVLYLAYLVTYLLNGWLEQGITPLLVFSGIFAGGYLTIWVIIYFVTKRKTAKLNQILQAKQQNSASH